MPAGRVMEGVRMALGRRDDERQDPMWIATDKLVQAPGHPFYARLNQLLAEAGFDRFVEERCRKFYAEGVGRPGIAPGVYFRMLFIGYFEGIDSERGIAWRCADSLGLRDFLGYDLAHATPNHSTLSVIRRRIDLETHQEVFDFVLKMLDQRGLIKGQTIGCDATTLEANAALRSIVRRDTGETYRAFLERLAKESGIQTPTREDLARLDRARQGKGNNDDWMNPNDPEAKIMKMKDGRTHLTHKAEHAVDMDTGATLAVTVQPADRGDCESIGHTLSETMENLATLSEGRAEPRQIREVVTDKGYHSNDVVTALEEMGIRTYVSEPKRRRRNWKGKQREKQAVYANRRRIRSERGKRLLRKRGELLERPFAHHYDTGGMRRTHLRTHAKILKRLLVHSGACNLGLLMRTLFGVGKPRALQGGATALAAALVGALWLLVRLVTAPASPGRALARGPFIPAPRPRRSTGAPPCSESWLLQRAASPRRHGP
ncbi:MAG: transposase, partial [Myxococcota bacterium]